MELSAALELGSLVTLKQEIEPYLVEWPLEAAADAVDGIPLAWVLVVATRPGGLLVAAPVGFFPEEALSLGNSEVPHGFLGPSTVVSVPGALLDNGQLAPTGTMVSANIVDLSEEALVYFRAPDAFETPQYAFDPDQPFSVPSPQELLREVDLWLENVGAQSGLGYVTAADGLDLEAPDLGALPPDGTGMSPGSTPRTPARPKAKEKAKATVPGPGRLTSPGAKQKQTVASLSTAMEQLIQSNMGLAKQVEHLTQKHAVLERRVAVPASSVSAPHSAVHQPLSVGLLSAPVGPSIVAKHLGTPPRTVAAMSPGLLGSPWLPRTEAQQLEEEKLHAAPSSSDDPLAKAVLAQSQALTQLVSQIASQNSEGVLDLGSGTLSSGTRGAQKRAKLQAELAQQKGSSLPQCSQRCPDECILLSQPRAHQSN